MKRRIAAWVACFMLVFALTTYHVNEARANAAIIVGVGIGAVVMMMMAAGLTFDSVGAANSAAGDFYGDFPDFESNIRNNTRLIRDAATGALKAVVTVTDSMWDTLKGWVDDNFDVGANGVYDVVEPDLSGYPDLPVSDLLAHSIITSFTYSTTTIRLYSWGGDIPTGTDWVALTGGVRVWGLNSTHTSWGTYVSSSSDNLYLPQCIVYWGSSPMANIYQPLQDLIGTVTGSPDAVDVYDWDWFNTRSGQRELQLPLIQSDTGDLAVGEDLYDADLDAALDGTDIAEATYEDVIGQDISGVPVVGEVDIPTEGVEDYPGETTEGSESETSLKALLFTKFPFCLPWDIKNAFELLLAEPEAPHFELDPFESVRDTMQLDGDTTISVDFADYPIIGQSCRWALTVLFTLGLIVLTRQIIRS